MLATVPEAAVYETQASLHTQECEVTLSRSHSPSLYLLEWKCSLSELLAGTAFFLVLTHSSYLVANFLSLLVLTFSANLVTGSESGPRRP